jgi:hypothetical protein
MTKRKIQYWVIPPACDAEFVANMEDVLSVYEKPYNTEIPVLCMDEQPSMKTRCLSSDASVVPFLYPSVGDCLAPVGFSKLGEGCPIR